MNYLFTFIFCIFQKLYKVNSSSWVKNLHSVPISIIILLIVKIITSCSPVVCMHYFVFVYHINFQNTLKFGADRLEMSWRCPSAPQNSFWMQKRSDNWNILFCCCPRSRACLCGCFYLQWTHCTCVHSNWEVSKKVAFKVANKYPASNVKHLPVKLRGMLNETKLQSLSPVWGLKSRQQDL